MNLVLDVYWSEWPETLAVQVRQERGAFVEDLALMLRSALPIDDIDQLMMSPTDGLAVVWVNISERPDLNALAARHDEEGSGYCICTFFYGNPGKSNMLIGLRVEMRQPTRTVFHLALKVHQYLEQLTLISNAGKIWIVPGPPPSHLVGTQAMTMADFMEKVMAFSGPGVMIELDPNLIAELKHQLDEWKQKK